MNCTACSLDHEWAPEWTTAGCPTRAKENLNPRQRTEMLMLALPRAKTKEDFASLLLAHIEAAARAPEEAAWLVWSFEHDAWWAPDERGYTRDVNLAGRYPQARAEEIVRNANLGCSQRNEAMLLAPEAEEANNEQR